jgi:hypothetical protein
MTRHRALMLLDSGMLLSFIVLMSWRLSGITAHEWIGFGLIALIFAHLIVHWGWVESTAAKAVSHDRRGRVIPLLLNAALFVAMGTALISGVVISKVVLPNDLMPGDYLQWHSLHESSATFALFIVGLHLALNWEWILGAVRRLFSAPRRSANAASWTRHVSARVMLRRVLSVLALTGVLIAAVWAKTVILPSHPQVLMRFPDGHTALVAPPADISRLQAGSTSPNPSRGGARLLLSVVLLSIATLIGRRVLRLRLNGWQDDREATSSGMPSGAATSWSETVNGGASADRRL